MKSFMIKYRGLRFLMILAFVVAVCAIAAAENENEDPEKAAIDTISEETEKAAPETIKEDTEEAPAETVDVEQEQREIEVLTTLEQRMQKNITIDSIDLPIDTVIRQLAEQADVDLIKSPQVIGNVTATLTDVPLEEALKNILRAHGFDYIMDKNMIRIVPVGELTEAEERLVPKVYTITYADVAGVEKALEKFVSQRGSIASNPSTSDIIVTDTESRIKAIDKFIEKIDRITAQVMVEARIYDIKSQDTLDLGVQWEAGRNTTHAGSVGTDPTGGKTYPFIGGGFFGATGKTDDTTIGSLRLGWLNHAVDIDALVSAEAENINAKLLANPRILVLDNETALFDIITQHPYIERTISGETITETIKYKDVGTKLQVTPHVTRDGMLRLHIIPEFGVKVRDVTLSSGAVPIIDTRSIDTIALVQDGQTVVLGGLRKKEVSQQTNKVPLLGDLPLIGLLFRFQGEDTTNSEIVVFITPRIITKAGLSEDEQQAYKETVFSRPKPVFTEVEKAAKDN
jgi:type IV pilus assembly protein PilQ